MNDREKSTPYPTPSNEPVFGEPVDAHDQINKYGTYEVQDTTDTDNTFPTIGPQGAGCSGADLPDAVKDKQRPQK
ncbi:MAG: hypothetical protein II363_05215 [Clostridia bacterium]|nr:hypothetical protein [Loktanella sp.]MBQ1950974.1 hypothetical protein [Clostridia bacterium]